MKFLVVCLLLVSVREGDLQPRHRAVNRSILFLCSGETSSSCCSHERGENRSMASIQPLIDTAGDLWNRLKIIIIKKQSQYKNGVFFVEKTNCSITLLFCKENGRNVEYKGCRTGVGSISQCGGSGFNSLVVAL